MKKLNVNDFVYVKLTQRGIDIYKEYYSEAAYFNGIDPMPPIDKHGYTKIQLWNLMQIFGNHMTLGCSVPFDPNIIFDERKLQDE